MRQPFFILFMMLLIAGLSAQNVGVGSTTPPSKFTVVGSPISPTIPGATSTGVFRVGISSNEGIDFGKMGSSPYSAWIQTGYNGIVMDPLAIQPLGGPVGMGTIAPHTSAVLDVTSTTKGFLPPRMTKVQRDAIATPAEGLIISCTDCSIKGLHQYINAAWQAMTSSNTGIYGTVVNPATGKVWLDRNLGATQVATSSTDAASYGDLYQWGRGADGHQLRTSLTTPTQATNWLAGGGGAWDGFFITTAVPPFNWLSTAETYMWSGSSAENNPCPSGFRVPTNAELEQERLTWSSNNAAGAFASPLKLPLAGGRNSSTGLLGDLGTFGYYRSSTASSSAARYLYFGSGVAIMFAGDRAFGFSVRCIKD